jgi:ABC-type branched-subunit amino acid transport system substrate-binding protein
MEAADLHAPALLAVNNALGTSNIDALNASIEGTDIEVVATEFHESGSTDLTPQMRALMDADPDVLIILNTAGADLTAALQARQSLGWGVPVLGFSSAANASVTNAVGPDGMEGVLAGQAYRLLAREPGETEPIGEAAVAFRERYKAFRGEDTLDLNLQQPAGIYDSFMMMAHAINEVGDVDPEGVRAYLVENGYEGVKATYEFTEERHDGVGLDDLAFVIADSLEDGVLEIAPGQ